MDVTMTDEPPETRQDSAQPISLAIERHTAHTSSSFIDSGETSPQSTDITINNDQFLQKPMAVLGRTSLWNVPAIYKYRPEQAKDIPAAAKVHAMSIHRIEKHWRNVKVAATGCLPPELESKTPYSLAMLTRLDKLAYLTAKKHGEALGLLRYVYTERRAVEQAIGGPKLPSRISTVPSEIWKQNKAQVVESRIWENREGLILRDVDRAVATTLAEGKKGINEKRLFVREGEGRRDAKKRVRRERKLEKREVERVVGKVVGLKMLESCRGAGDENGGKLDKSQKEYQEVEKLLGRSLRKGERRQIGRTRKKIVASVAAGSGGNGELTYSLASSGQGGSIFIVRGPAGYGEEDDYNDSEKKMKATEKTPAMSEEGRKFLQEHKYVDNLSLQDPLRQKGPALGQTTRDTIQHTDTGIETGEFKDTEESLSSAMRDHSISPSKIANDGERVGDTKMQLD
ncbi:hypothetical protein CERZMDRAFT_98230 [Cercospora zeae-maydis SCOH1-5]|uniref:Uncharacterized protein n=1 Tax=Cercospora zeae-maydis SCOH1-5 TaxID=717836 RepID=A0A6A6FEZ0_9PEZI|nr:hypothetical protein CERZMDRAFT_98230 [Cercospora zeae-maydis SCOH1-5]